MLVLTFSPRAVLLLVSQAPVARHHGRLGPQDSVEFHRCSSWTRFSPCPLLCSECLCPDSALHNFGVSAVAVLHGRRFPVAVQRPIPCRPLCSQLLRYMCSTSPGMQAVQFPRWFAVLDTLTTCPLLVTTGVWSWTVLYCRLTSPSLQMQVPMVLTVQINNVADVLVMLFVLVPQV